MLDKKAQTIVMLKIKFVSNSATLGVTNSFFRNSDIQSQGNVSNFRFKVNRISQDYVWYFKEKSL